MYLNAVGDDEAALRSWETLAKIDYSVPVYIAEALRLGRTQAVIDFLKRGATRRAPLDTSSMICSRKQGMEPTRRSSPPTGTASP